MSAGPSSGVSLPNRPTATLVKSHEAHSSIRALSAKQKQKQKEKERVRQEEQNGKADGNASQPNNQGLATKGKGKQKAGNAVAGTVDKDVIKTVLASPMTPRWPKIDDQQQKSILVHLLTFFPGLADYHAARGRNNKKRKKHNRALLREAALSGHVEAETVEGAEENQDEPVQTGSKRTALEGDRPTKRLKIAHNPSDGKTTAPAVSPDGQGAVKAQPTHANADDPLLAMPPCAPHMIIGINETMKAMEKQTADLLRRIHRLRGTEPAVLNGLDEEGSRTASKRRASGLPSNLIPTAAAPTGVDMNSHAVPADADGAPDVTTKNTTLAEPPSQPRNPLRVIFVCLPDINPPHLVHAIPMYVTTWNSMVREHRNLQRAAAKKSDETLAAASYTAAGKTAKDADGEVAETLLVPLPKGAELQIARVFGLRRVAVFGLTTAFPDLNKLLKTIISANIKVMLPPFPILPSSGPLPTSATYAPTHLKAVLTTAPADSKARKAARIAGVKAARDRQREAKFTEKQRIKKEGVIIQGMLCGGADGLKRERARVKMEKRKEKAKERRIAAAATKGEKKADARPATAQTALPRLLPTAPPPAA